MVFTSKHNMEMTTSEKLLKKRKKNWGGIFSDMTSSKKGRGSELYYFQQFFRTAFKQLENQTPKISSQFSDI